MPWPAFSCDLSMPSGLSRYIFNRLPKFPAIAAFGADGHLLTKESNLASKYEWSSKFPFIQADMGQEVRVELLRKYKWDLEFFESPRAMGEDSDSE